MQDITEYKIIEFSKAILIYGIISAILIGLGVYSFFTLEHEGHWLTGMNNQVVWGVPHMFAIFLIIAASGVLNIASISSVFNIKIYKPLARLSALLAIALLTGGLIVLVLDLGRPERLIVAMTTFNFKSIFAWNIFLYSGFVVIAALYLWMMFEARYNKFSQKVGTFAFIWRVILTTGTGSIFGFLVAKEAYNGAILAPLFIALSLLLGTAIFYKVLFWMNKGLNIPLGSEIILRFRKLLIYFTFAVFYLTILSHLTNLYATKHHEYEFFLLFSGNIYTILFWIGQILIGTFIPLLILYSKNFSTTKMGLLISSALIILGGFFQLYVIIISGQAFPLDLFPGYTESSSFQDGIISPYTPSMYEFMLGLGGIGISAVIYIFAIMILDFTPKSLDNDALKN
ncbi:MAG: Hdr menaquinol oxidoreductase integral membrane subunit [Thiotrichaceae bacterium]|jgi:molybdopterin-containing oxidoreductase family membrane subunit|nr:NrfD/PsrC family molybdoenzyme membrane anchor subunit [Pseudomonadota bacterium]GIR92578.1 MAG: Hdr menaquinol oxidoreductase integral membrane subunit [Thiotrichaceae bacterium]|tara:strand:- start:684 stop:1880 length:1197 start_codon:yes stop_codon:yes gene_type:complete